MLRDLHTYVDEKTNKIVVKEFTTKIKNTKKPKIIPFPDFPNIPKPTNNFKFRESQK